VTKGRDSNRQGYDHPKVAEAAGTVTNRLYPAPQSRRSRDREGIERVDIIDLNLDLDPDSARSVEVLTAEMMVGWQVGQAALARAGMQREPGRPVDRTRS
jgi:hypothetical protein